MARYGLWATVHGTYLVLKQVLLILALSLTQIILTFLIFIVEAGKIRIKCVRNPLLHIILCERKRERARLAFRLCGETCFICVYYINHFQLLATPLTTSRKLVYILYATVVRGQSNESRFSVGGRAANYCPVVLCLCLCLLGSAYCLRRELLQRGQHIPYCQHLQSHNFYAGDADSGVDVEHSVQRWHKILLFVIENKQLFSNILDCLTFKIS